MALHCTYCNSMSLYRQDKSPKWSESLTVSSSARYPHSASEPCGLTPVLQIVSCSWLYYWALWLTSLHPSENIYLCPIDIELLMWFTLAKRMQVYDANGGFKWRHGLACPPASWQNSTVLISCWCRLRDKCSRYETIPSTIIVLSKRPYSRTFAVLATKDFRIVTQHSS